MDASISFQVNTPQTVVSIIFHTSPEFTMVTFFVFPIIHWSPSNPFSYSLNYANTILYLLNTVTLRVRCGYTTIWSTSIGELIYRYSNTLNVRSIIAHTTVGPVWSNASINGNFLFTRFCLVVVRILLCMIRIYDSSPPSVLLPYSIS